MRISELVKLSREIEKVSELEGIIGFVNDIKEHEPTQAGQGKWYSQSIQAIDGDNKIYISVALKGSQGVPKIAKGKPFLAKNVKIKVNGKFTNYNTSTFIIEPDDKDEPKDNLNTVLEKVKDVVKTNPIEPTNWNAKQAKELRSKIWDTVFMTIVKDKSTVDLLEDKDNIVELVNELAEIGYKFAIQYRDDTELFPGPKVPTSEIGFEQEEKEVWDKDKEYVPGVPYED